jgi:hypothetical protein
MRAGRGAALALSAGAMVFTATAAAAAHMNPDVIVGALSTGPGLGPSRLASHALPLDAMARVEEAQAEAPADASTQQSDGRLGNAGRSLILPGWGQLHGGHRTLGLCFLVAEAAIWTTFTVFLVQGELREDSYEETARLFAGLDLDTVGDEFRGYLAEYESSEEYNRLVVYRQAAALYYGDFENYNRYIEENSIGGDQAWAWTTFDYFAQYGAQRRSSDQAYHDAELMVALAVVNRVASAIVAARMEPVPPEPKASTSGVSTGPTWGLRLDPRGRPEPRVAWELRFR